MDRNSAVINLLLAIAITFLGGCDPFYFEGIRINAGVASVQAEKLSRFNSIEHAYDTVFRVVRETVSTDPLLVPSVCPRQYYLCEKYGKASFGLMVYVTDETKSVINIELSESNFGPSKAGTALLDKLTEQLNKYYEKKDISRNRTRTNGNP